MTDMDVFLLLSLDQKTFGFTPEGALVLLRAITNLPVSKLDAQQFLAHPPKTKQIVHAMHDRGFRPGYIQEYLNVSQSTISYHLATECKPYVNPVWRAYVEHWTPLLKPLV